MTQANSKGETFGAWLRAQRGRDGLVGDLVASAKSDPAFPRDGGPDDVRRHLIGKEAHSDMFDAIDDAEVDWLRS